MLTQHLFALFKVKYARLQCVNRKNVMCSCKYVTYLHMYKQYYEENMVNTSVQSIHVQQQCVRQIWLHIMCLI